MRVVFATAGTSISGGIAVVARSVVDAIGSAREQGDIEWAGFLAFHGDESAAGAFDWTRTARSNRARFVAQLARLVSTQSIDLVLFDTIGLARSSEILRGPLRRPYIVIAHGREIDLVGERRSAARALMGASAIITVSRTSLDSLRTQLGHRMPPIGVISPCVTRDRIATWSSLAGQRDLRQPTILSVGRMRRDEPGKGHETLVRAHRSVVETCPDAQLILVGDGDKRGQLEALAQQEGVGENVQFPGFVSDYELGEYYRSATLFAMPSQQEGFGIVYAEAMWHGLPCIGSTSDAARDVIDDERTGLLVPFGNAMATAGAIKWLLSNQAEAKTFGENGRAKCCAEYVPAVFERRLLETLLRGSQESPSPSA